MRDASWYLGVEIKQAQLILLNRKWGRCFNELLCHHQQRRSHLLTRFCYLRFTGPIILYGLTPFQNKRSCIVFNPMMPDQEIMDGKLCPFNKMPKLPCFFICITLDTSTITCNNTAVFHIFNLVFLCVFPVLLNF